MKLKILKALEQGFNVMEKRPVILIPAVIVALLSAYIYYVAEMFMTSFLLIDETFVGFSSLASSIALIFIISELIGIFLYGMIIKIAADSKKRISLGRTAKFVAGKYLRLLVAHIVFGALILIGYIAFIVPGIFLTIKLMFYQYSIIIDNKSVTDSLKKSWNVTKKNWWRVFALMLIISIISAALNQIAYLFSLKIGAVVLFFVTLFVTAWSISSMTMAYMQLAKKK